MLLAILSPRQIAEWMAYALVEPFGSPAIDWATSRVIAHLLSPHLKPGAHIEPRDFMPDRQSALARHLEEKHGGEG